jgi:epoxyqueuosine reductase
MGFHQLAVLSAPIAGEGFQDAKQGLQQWLNSGFQADMTWMENHLEKRLSPEDLMPGTQSILCVTLNYNTGPQPDTSEAKIARYARGEDYHRVVKQKLKTLLAWLQTFDPTLEGRALTDSAPILEKALAVQAGFGWQGKHSCLITKDLGSWVFLGELFLSRPIPDAPEPEPMANHCGRCRRCIDACPTDAIVADGVVDANRCIAYWTIESKADDFPDLIANNLNGWLFGCDICQDVCPWNIKFEKPSPEAAFYAQPVYPWNDDVNLNNILALDEDGFRTRYKHSPIKRAKLTGLKRNARYLVQSVLH